eukprot:m.771074 g.771074  ORF g.771074 m.771074 type:complete len:51 (-) comp59087_c0_seq3:118-270(-)
MLGECFSSCMVSTACLRDGCSSLCACAVVVLAAAAAAVVFAVVVVVIVVF